MEVCDILRLSCCPSYGPFCIEYWYGCCAYWAGGGWGMWWEALGRPKMVSYAVARLSGCARGPIGLSMEDEGGGE